MVIDRYEETLKPMHELYIEPSKRYADLIVPQGGHNNVASKTAYGLYTFSAKTKK